MIQSLFLPVLCDLMLTMCVDQQTIGPSLIRLGANPPVCEHLMPCYIICFTQLLYVNVAAGSRWDKKGQVNVEKINLSGFRKDKM